MYGREGAYFGDKKNGFVNSAWIELIGFDNTAKDYGVSDLINKMGFVPDCISFHLTSIDFVNTHRGMEEELRLPEYACSYFGHTHNDDRERQDWTNYQLKDLVKELQNRGIKAYASFFDLEADSGIPSMPKFCDAHPELRVVDSTGQIRPFINMIKRFKDGSPYEDYLLKNFLKVLEDYSLDGIQIADGISCPRLSLQEADFSDDVVEQFLSYSEVSLPGSIKHNCTAPEEFQQRADWILDEYKAEWIAFNTQRWSSFMEKIIKGIRSAGKDAAFNSAWTKDPLEAIYRYGADYKAFVKAGATSVIVEDVSADLAILADVDVGYDMDYPHRKFVHYEFAAELMANKAQLPETTLTPLFMIRDTLEQWDVIHHMPVAMQRAAATNLNNYLVHGDGGMESITNGPHFCLADGLTAEEWRFTRLAWDNAYTIPYSVPGVTVVWSEERMHAEINALIKTRRWHTTKWISELMRYGAPVHKIVNIEDIDSVTGPLLIINSDLLPMQEQQKALDYKSGPILLLGGQVDMDEKSRFEITMENGWGKTVFQGFGDVHDYESQTFKNDKSPAGNIKTMREPAGGVWTHPLNYADIDNEFVRKCTEIMIDMTAYPTVSDANNACHVIAVYTSPDSMKLFVENEEFYYAMPWIDTGREITGIDAITKPQGYPIRVEGSKFKLRVPGRGMDVIEIQFKEEVK